MGDIVGGLYEADHVPFTATTTTSPVFYMYPYPNFWRRADELFHELEVGSPQVSELAHYTNLGSAAAILESGQLYATDPRLLNDKAELRRAEEQLQEIADLGDIPVGAGVPEVVQNVLSSPLSHMRYAVACFCQHDDLLSQWRGYGVGAPDTPYAIVLSRADLHNFRVSTNPAVKLLRVIYQPEQQRRIISDLLQALSADLREPPQLDADRRQGLDMPVASAAEALRQVLNAFRPAFKHHSFSEEQEWRLVAYHHEVGRFQSDGAQPPFRQTRVGMASYARLEWDADIYEDIRRDPVARRKLPLVRLRQGPSSEPDVAEGAMTDFLKSMEPYLGVPVLRTGIPFRY